MFYFYQVKAVVLDPENEFNVDRTLTKDDVQKLIKVIIIDLSNNFKISVFFFIRKQYPNLKKMKMFQIKNYLSIYFLKSSLLFSQLCVDRLMDSRCPSLDTVKMQVYFDMNYTTRGIKMHQFFLNGIQIMIFV